MDMLKEAMSYEKKKKEMGRRGKEAGMLTDKDIMRAGGGPDTKAKAMPKIEVSRDPSGKMEVEIYPFKSMDAKANIDKFPSMDAKANIDKFPSMGSKADSLQIKTILSSAKKPKASVVPSTESVDDISMGDIKKRDMEGKKYIEIMKRRMGK